ncbi:PAAR domain-containing protein [Nonomuraea bangladeshensis]|uniref:PAAR domain-containing protein n=1 Tax=Nonomuraea bangladeshensis TaxID=404385 RepID=UPI003C30842E
MTMPPAARVTDLTAHGGAIIGPGVPTVLVGGLPAAVLGDLHACPIQPGHPPSTPFPVGSVTVLIGGKPALRAGDAAGCGATVVVGAPTVLVG